jgi:HlyD family secretion protein
MPKHIVGSRRAVIAVTTGVVVVGAATSAWALSGSSGATYRTATAARGSVEQTLTTTGAISPVREANLTFEVAGTVGRVRVSPGHHVHAGQVLARLDRSSLRASVDNASSTLSKARAALVSDETTQTSSAATGSTGSTGTSPLPSATPSPTASTTTGSSPRGSGTTGASTRIAHDQRAVLAAQRQADQDLANARAALKAAKTACANELNGSADETSGSGSTTNDTTACSNATSTLLTEQTAVSTDQRAVASAEAALARDLGSAAAATTGSARTDSIRTASLDTTAAQPTTQTAVSPTSAPTSSSATSAAATTDAATSTRTPTASQLAADQATIDADRATLATAKADLAQAVLRSPISGRVTAVTVGKGDAVSTGSSSSGPAIRVVGSQQSKVTVDLSASQVRTVTTGLRAHITPDGSAATVSGAVSSIALAPTTSSTGDSTYPVVITLSHRATSLVSGADAEVTIQLSTADNVMTVPTSAVHRSGTTTYVETLTNGKPVRRTVKIGAVGAALTQIRSGLSDGQRVVLANLGAAVPSSSTNLTSGSGLSSRFGNGTQVGGGSGPVVAPPGGSTQLGPS